MHRARVAGQPDGGACSGPRSRRGPSRARSAGSDGRAPPVTASDGSVRCLLHLNPTLSGDLKLGSNAGVSSMMCNCFSRSMYLETVLASRQFLFSKPVSLAIVEFEASVDSLRANDLKRIIIFSSDMVLPLILTASDAIFLI